MERITWKSANCVLITCKSISEIKETYEAVLKNMERMKYIKQSIHSNNFY